MKGYKRPGKTGMTVDLFREGDVVAPSFGPLLGVRGVVSNVGSYIAIEFPRPVEKYRHMCARSTWDYMPSNVRLIALARRRPNAKKV